MSSTNHEDGDDVEDSFETGVEYESEGVQQVKQSVLPKLFTKSVATAKKFLFAFALAYKMKTDRLSLISRRIHGARKTRKLSSRVILIM